MATNFDLKPDGNIKVSPLTGYSTVLAAGMACLVRLEYVNSAEEMAAGKVSAVQLVLTPAQAAELAESLLNIARLAARRDDTSPKQ